MAVTAAAAFASLVTVAAPAGAAKPQPVSGTIDLVAEAPSYGDSVEFDTSVSGKMAAHSYTYIQVVCLQGDDVVYQVSQRDLSAPFELNERVGLEWDGGDAHCLSALVYRVDKKRGDTVTYLDITEFDVEGA